MNKTETEIYSKKYDIKYELYSEERCVEKKKYYRMFRRRKITPMSPLDMLKYKQFAREYANYNYRKKVNKIKALTKEDQEKIREEKNRKNREYRKKNSAKCKEYYNNYYKKLTPSQRKRRKEYYINYHSKIVETSPLVENYSEI